MHMLFYLAIIILTGIVVSKILGKFKLPNVTGYLIAGILIGPSILGLIPSNVIGNFSVISEMALAFIAYSIGSELNLERLKKIGKGILPITFFESFFPMLFVSLGTIFIFKQPIFMGIILGAISAATAPAATIMVIKQYHARGPVVETLLPVVALDDAAAIMYFGIASSIGKALIDKSATISIINMILIPLLEIILALLLGLLTGIIVAFISKKVKGEDELLSLIIAFIFLISGIAIQLNLSSLLTCMMFGATLANIIPSNRKVFTTIEQFTPPILILFFVISGVELNFSVLKTVGILGIVYVILRSLGKFFGAYIGSAISNSPKTVKQFLGLTLLPQAGVAIGLSMIAQNILPSPYGEQIRSIVLGGVIIYELIGPYIVRITLVKAGEIVEKN
ncbi:cation:proton antiporter [Petrotoga sp. 9PWA.NaAc.5.4]|uniref:cation:proton antiporter n=1 Tax=Petrotoga sp. 9PWA.NaAc.5.4 TaxID=1434328 RepID=UPI000CAD35BE|nr:cation:proton antiporter [Petrotoga sp. 9PWA.NaAc.5.4]PNR93980.1 sodium/hydrogen exchanger [Petrotoga sp. 9PWA.NaAc.5.4]